MQAPVPEPAGQAAPDPIPPTQQQQPEDRPAPGRPDGARSQQSCHEPPFRTAGGHCDSGSRRIRSRRRVRRAVAATRPQPTPPKIYEDKISGAKAERPGLALALEVARAGDTLVVWRLDRLGRSLKDLIALAERLVERQVGLRSLKEALDTASSGGRLIFHMFASLAEFERDLIRERTRAGLSAARARGRLGGRPKLLTPEKRKLAVQLYRAKEHSIAEICRLMGISKPTLYSYLAEAGG